MKEEFEVTSLREPQSLAHGATQRFCDLETRRKQMLKLYQMEHMVEDQTREHPREAELHRQMRQAGVIQGGWVSLRVRRLAAYLRCLPAILAQSWRRCALPPGAARDATPEAACRD